MSSNPGEIKEIINLDLKRPRDEQIKKTSKFKELELMGETLLQDNINEKNS